jgi:F-type H+-transporting ATPase subunit delta
LRTLRIARGYAKALVQSADDAGSVADVDAGLTRLQEMLDGSPDLAAFFTDPMIAPGPKGEIVAQIFGEDLPPLLQSFVALLVEKRRERELAPIVAETRRLLNERAGIETAYVRSAIALSDAQTQELKSNLERITGKTMRVEVEVDASVMGGFVVRIQDTIYDASMETQILRLQDALTAAR